MQFTKKINRKPTAKLNGLKIQLLISHKSQCGGVQFYFEKMPSTLGFNEFLRYSNSVRIVFIIKREEDEANFEHIYLKPTKKSSCWSKHKACPITHYTQAHLLNYAFDLINIHEALSKYEEGIFFCCRMLLKGKLLGWKFNKNF